MSIAPRDRPLILVALYALVYFAVMRLPGDILGSPIAGSDLSSYYTAGYLVRSGQAGSLYEVGPGDTILGDATSGPWREAGDRLGLSRQHYYIYPPFFALLAVPLSLLPFPAARLAWMGADLLLLGLSVAIYLRWRRLDGTSAEPPELALIAVTLCLEFLPLIWELAIGQTSLLLLALLAGTMLLAKQRRESWAGILLGLAAAIKLTPALLIVYFALRGRSRLAARAAICFAACTLTAILLLGPAASVRFFAQIVPAMSGGTAYFLNQSLAGFFDRLIGGGDVRQVALEPAAGARLLASAASMVLLGATALVVRRAAILAGGRPEGLALDLEASAVILLTLIMSPISWSHHYVLALIPLWTAVAAASRWLGRRAAVAAAMGVAFLLIARKPHFELFLSGVSRVALSAALYGALILWAVCLLLIARGADPARRRMELPRAA